jgi:poly-gamma-glutamate synthesis protein (capsule biosynthesis protein)
VIHGTGNVSLDTDHIPSLRSNGYGWAWSGLEGLFRRDDLTVINLECPVTRAGAPVRNGLSFRCDPGALPAARRAGIDVANLANDHGDDRGPQGVLDSIRNLRAAGIAPVGAGRDGFAAEPPAIFDIRGWRVAVLGFGAVLVSPNQTAGPGDPGTATVHPFPHALRAIRAADRVADIVIVTIRWDVAKRATRPRGRQVHDGHAMVDAGADVIFGHHSHRRDGSPRLHPLTIYRGSPIFWGLGNLVGPSHSIGGSSTVVAEVTVMREGRLRARLLPATIVSDGHPVLGCARKARRSVVHLRW